MINRLVRRIKIYYYAALLALFDAMADELPRLRPWAHRKGDEVWRKFARAKSGLFSSPLTVGRIISLTARDPATGNTIDLTPLTTIEKPWRVNGISLIEKEVRRFAIKAELPFFLDDVVIHLQQLHLIPTGFVSGQTKADISRYLQSAGAQKITKVLYGSDLAHSRILHTYQPASRRYQAR